MGGELANPLFGVERRGFDHVPEPDRSMTLRQTAWFWVGDTILLKITGDATGGVDIGIQGGVTWNPEVAKTLSRLADVMSATGEYDKAEPLIQQALRIRRKSFGQVHSAVAESIADLGVNAGDRNDYKLAEVYLRQALEMQRKLQKGAAHPLLAEALNNLFGDLK